MNKMEFGDKRMKKRKWFLWVLVFSFLFCQLVGCGKKVEADSLREKVEKYQGFQRLVEEEEYQLYCYFVEREQGHDVTEPEPEEKVREYANEVNAIFHLANKFGLCEPYSYEGIKLRMEQENELRKIKKEKGEAIYGLEKFSLEQFFLYKLGTVEADLRSYLQLLFRRSW